MSKQKKLFILLGLFVVLGGIYWGVGGTKLTLLITYCYYALCLILSVLYVLVAGGIRPVADEKCGREVKSPAVKGEIHPVKKRDKYRRFRVKTELKEERSSALNLLNIPEEKRGILCTWLLLSAIPFYLIFLLDWIFLKFFAGI